MTRFAWLLMLAPLALQAQLALYVVNGGTETAAGPTYNVGTIASGDSRDTRFRARNSGSAPVTITQLAVSGAGFSIVQTPSTPFVIAGGSFQDIYVHFTGTLAASYSANFQVNNISVLLTALVTPTPVVATGPGCGGPDAFTGQIIFGNIQTLQTGACVVILTNLNPQSITLSNIAVSGSGFSLAQILHTPVVLNTGSSFSFTINFSPQSAGLYSGTLTIDARTFPLSGSAFTPSLPPPILEFDPGLPGSGQQRSISMRLPSPSPIAASGALTLSFRPDTSVVADDPAIVFVATGTRSVPFSIKPGETRFLLGGQPEAVFQTGTTSGQISFTVSAGASLTAPAPPAVMTIPPSVVGIDNATATGRIGSLDVQVWGFDNTYSMGAMSFTFYDWAGNVIGAGPVSADFSAQFHAYFSAAPAGSAFQMRVSFPLSTGDPAKASPACQGMPPSLMPVSCFVGSVDVKLSNIAGSATLQKLKFN